MQEEARKLLLNSTITDIEGGEDSTTFYLKDKQEKSYSIEVKSGETVIRSLEEEKKVAHEVFSASDIEDLKGFCVTGMTAEDPDGLSIGFIGPNGEEAYLTIFKDGQIFYSNDL